MAQADPQQTFSVHEAKTHLSRLMDRAHSGGEIVLAKAVEPWAKIVPIAPPPPKRRTPRGLRPTSPIPELFWQDRWTSKIWPLSAIDLKQSVAD